MGRIDQETVQRILDTADIVEVVSDFVSLKRRGANYVGLCPFHNERTPSFSVSKAKGYCKCFSCGKGGSAVGFLMEIEQISYNEALRYLARKYNIEIRERELTDKERQEATDRESLFAVNDWALKHFEGNLANTDDGRDIGLSYFRERGINDWAIRRFHLGYSLNQRNEFYEKAKAAGFSDRYLVESGVCIRNDRGEIYDRFKGRVIYPIFTVSGKVVGFGGRTLRNDKQVAKYVNSPETAVYRKSYELYGLYQAKQAISKLDRCILVEGYMDVISMHQSGVENVVASSGTSLTEGQIRLIHRFTPNITVIYDSDPAGIKASLRGIDMILAEGMDVKVVLLPQGDDPDSFAQSHTTEQILDYLDKNSTDFISFKTKILLEGTHNDPIARSKAITDIVQSISVIPDMITRTVYTTECAKMLGIDEGILTRQINKFYTARRDSAALQKAKDDARRSLQGLEQSPSGQTQPADETPNVTPIESSHASYLKPYERNLLRYVLRYGVVDLGVVWLAEQDDAPNSIKLIDFVDQELRADEIEWTDPLCKKAFDLAMALRRESWDNDYARAHQQLMERREQQWAEGVAQIRSDAVDLSDVKARESALQTRLDEEFNAAVMTFATQYIEKRLASCEDSEVRDLTLDLVSEKYQLSKVHTKYAKIETEQDRLDSFVERAVYELKDAILSTRISDLKAEIRKVSTAPNPDPEAVLRLMERNVELDNLRAQFAKFLGERIVAPRKQR